MAGVSINRITQVLGGDIQVVRAMPNMAAFIAEAVTCIAMNGPVDKKPDIVDILMGIGLVIEVKEDQMDAVTAVSGSGPAYLFFLADAMMSAASGLGLGQKEADMLVRQTLYGSAALLKGSEEGPDELISKVASKGGTTEAALSVFKKKGLAGAIEEAVRAAKKRSGELSGGLS